MECSDFVQRSLNYLNSVVHSTTQSEHGNPVETQKPVMKNIPKTVKSSKDTTTKSKNENSTKNEIKPLAMKSTVSQNRNNTSETERHLLILDDLTATDTLDVFLTSNGFEALKRVITNFDDKDSIINSVNVIISIAMKSNTYRDLVVEAAGVVEVLVRKIEEVESIPVLKSLSRALLIICCEYDEDLPKLPKINITESLTKLLLLRDEDITLSACLITSCICNEEVYQFDDRSDVVFGKDMCNRLVELVKTEGNKKAIRAAALFTIAVIASLNADQSNLLISCGCLACLNDVIENEELHLYTEKSICLFMKNICDTADEAVLQNLFGSNLVPYIISIIGDPFGPDLANRRMISAALDFASSKSTSEQIKYLVEEDCISAILRNLKVDDIDEEFLVHAATTLKNILDQGRADDIKEYKNIFHEYLGRAKFQKILSTPHVSENVKVVASGVIGLARKGKTGLIGTIASRFSLSKSNK